MCKFKVTVTTATHRYRFNALGANSCDVLEAAAREFDDVRCIVVMPLEVVA